jgi:hypothetical protein
VRGSHEFLGVHAPPAPPALAEPIITYAEGKPFAVFCGVCRSGCVLVTAERPLETALALERKHCAPKLCQTCGTPSSTYGCEACREAREQKRIEDDFRKATKIPIEQYGEPFVALPAGRYLDPESWEEDDEAFEVDGVRFVWGTSEDRPAVDLQRECMECWLEEQHEDAYEHVDDAKLAEAQKLVDEALAGVFSYVEDRSVAVILPPNAEEQ